MFQFIQQPEQGNGNAIEAEAVRLSITTPSAWLKELSSTQRSEAEKRSLKEWMLMKVASTA